jgi:hypothetical protein
MKSTLGTKATMIALAVIAFWAVAAGAAVNILQLPISLPDTLRSVCCGVNGKQLASGIIFAILIFKALYDRYFHK